MARPILKKWLNRSDTEPKLSEVYKVHKTDSDRRFAHPSLLLHGWKSTKFGLDYSTQSPLSHRRFAYSKYKTSTGSANYWLCPPQIWHSSVHSRLRI